MWCIMNEVLSRVRAGNGQSWAASSSIDLDQVNFLCQLKHDKAGRIWCTAVRGGENLKHNRQPVAEKRLLLEAKGHITQWAPEKRAPQQRWGKFKVGQYDLSWRLEFVEVYEGLPPLIYIWPLWAKRQGGWEAHDFGVKTSWCRTFWTGPSSRQPSWKEQRLPDCCLKLPDFFLRLEGEEEVSHREEEKVSQLGSPPSLLPSPCPSAYLSAYQGVCLTLGPAVGYILFSKVSETDRRSDRSIWINTLRDIDMFFFFTKYLFQGLEGRLECHDELAWKGVGVY